MTGHGDSAPRIAVVLPDLRPGGAERVHIDLAREWIARGLNVDFVLMARRGELLSVVPDGARIIDLGVRRVRGVIPPLRQYAISERPDVVLAAMWPLTSFVPLACLGIRPAIRVAVSEHAILSEQYAEHGRVHRALLRASTSAGYRAANIRIAVSRGVAADMASLSGLPVQLVTVLYNPIAGRPRPPLPPEALSEPVRLPGRVILSVGTLKDVKGHELLIEAFARIASDPDLTLCIVGEGELRPRLEDLVARRGLSGRVVMPGFRIDPNPFYERASLFVLASFNEGLGNVLVEALEHGVPVVSTDCPTGPREVLEGGRFGRLVPVGDVGGLARAMRAALDEEPDREALKRRALDFDVGIVAERYLDAILPRWRASSGRTPPAPPATPTQRI